MTDPARWSSLNESEREVLRAAREYPTNTARMVAASDALTSNDPPEAPIEMPKGWTDATAFGSLPRSSYLHCEYGRVAVRGGVFRVKTRINSGWSHDAMIPVEVAAIALRSAGWRVEAPK